jgi:hypothetical protein
MFAKVSERLALSTNVTWKFDMEEFSHRKLSELEVSTQHTYISNRFAAIEILYDSENISRDWENIKGNIKTSAKESLRLHNFKQHKSQFE